MRGTRQEVMQGKHELYELYDIVRDQGQPAKVEAEVKARHKSKSKGRARIQNKPSKSSVACIGCIACKTCNVSRLSEQCASTTSVATGNG
jgi:hypothetical protein